MTPPTLLTPRLRIRPVRMSDAPEIQRHISQWEVAQHLTSRIPWPYPPDGAETFLRDVALPRMGAGELYTWAITEGRDSDLLIGVISITTDESCRDQRGFWLAPAFWGRGLTTEAADAVTDWAFTTLGLERIVTSNAVDNPRSHRMKARGPWELIGIEESDYVAGTLPTAVWRVTRAAWLAWRQDQAQR